MAHQLYVLQVLTFNLLEDRMMTKMDPQDQVSAPQTTLTAGGLEHESIVLLSSQNLGEWI